MRKIVSALVAAGLAGVCSAVALSASQSVTVPMHGLNGGKQGGVAVFTQLPAGVRVVVSLRNEPAGAEEPTHLHAGACDAPDRVPAFALQNTVNGKSVSFLPNARLGALLGKDAVVVHQSLRDLRVYVSCGSVRR